jgi:cell division protein FtsL
MTTSLILSLLAILLALGSVAVTFLTVRRLNRQRESMKKAEAAAYEREAEYHRLIIDVNREYKRD